MSIADKITKLQTDITNAYSSIEAKNGTIPTNKNTENLAGAIDSITGGGTPIYTVTFDSNGGSTVASQQIVEGYTVKEPTAPTKTGYKFLYWILNGVEYDFSTLVTSDITLVAEWKEALVPEAYTQVEYLKFSETQYVDTGLPVAPNFYVDTDILLEENPSTYGGVIMGASSESNYRFWVFSLQQARTINCGLINNSISTKILKINQKHNVYIKFFNGEQKLYVDDELYCSASNTATTSHLSDFALLPNLRIGAKANSNTDGWYNGRIYRFKMNDENNTLIRDYIPVLRNSDNVAGMYDRVNKTFNPNAGTGTFLVGSVVE